MGAGVGFLWGPHLDIVSGEAQRLWGQGPTACRAGTKRCAIRFTPVQLLQTDEAERMDRGVKSEMRGGWQRWGCIPFQPGSSCTWPQLIARSDFFQVASYLSFHLKLTTYSDLKRNVWSYSMQGQENKSEYYCPWGPRSLCYLICSF